MSIKMLDNDTIKSGGQILFIPENCEYLNGGKKLELIRCKINCFNDELERQIIKTIYGVSLGGGVMSVNGDSVCINDAIVYCSGNLEIFAKELAAFCRKIFGKEEITINE